MGIIVKNVGDFETTLNFLKHNRDADIVRTLRKYGQKGVNALATYTPMDTGKTAKSWDYEILKVDKGYKLIFTNSNLAEPGMPIAILIQFGHATKNGGYVRGVDYINPALAPVFQEIYNEIWGEITE